MVTKIIQVGDIHIRNLRRINEYHEQFSKFLEECNKIVEENGKEETRIVLAGDLLHNKLDISSEGYTLAAWFLEKLGNICPTIVFAGNHDLNMLNVSRMDPISAIFMMCKFENVKYLDMELGYESGTYHDDNIVWCLYSAFDSFRKPNITEERIETPNSTFVGLYHGEVKGAMSDAGYKSEGGLDSSYFDGIDFGILGHIHKRQELTYNGIPLVYCGSLIQQDHGENIHGHGFVVWNVDDYTWEPVDLSNEENGFYTFTINDIDDIDEDKETIINL